MTIKFVASTISVNPDTDIFVQDIGSQPGQWSIDQIMDEAKQVTQSIHIIGDGAERAVAFLNEEWEKETNLPMDAEPELVAAATETKNEEVKGAVNMNNLNTVGMVGNGEGVAQSKLAHEVLAATQSVNKTNEKSDVKMNKANTTVGVTRRLGAGVGTVGGASQAPSRRLNLNLNTNVQFDENIHRSERKTFTKGPWYLNADLYEVAARIDQVVEDRADAELGVTDIRLLAPSDVFTYETNDLAVVEVSFGVQSLRFRIQENTNEKSASPLKSSNIGWLESKNNRLYPAYGRYTKDALTVKMADGKTTYVYVDKDGQFQQVTKLSDVTAYKFQRSDVFVSREIMALAMGFAHKRMIAE